MFALLVGVLKQEKAENVSTSTQRVNKNRKVQKQNSNLGHKLCHSFNLLLPNVAEEWICLLWLCGLEKMMEMRKIKMKSAKKSAPFKVFLHILHGCLRHIKTISKTAQTIHTDSPSYKHTSDGSKVAQYCLLFTSLCCQFVSSSFLRQH